MGKMEKSWKGQNFEKKDGICVSRRILCSTPDDFAMFRTILGKAESREITPLAPGTLTETQQKASELKFDIS